MEKKEASQKWKRIAMSFFGVIVTGFCIGAFQKANLGADPLCKEVPEADSHRYLLPAFKSF